MKRPLIQIVLPVCLMILPRLAAGSEASTLTWDKRDGRGVAHPGRDIPLGRRRFRARSVAPVCVRGRATAPQCGRAATFARTIGDRLSAPGARWGHGRDPPRDRRGKGCAGHALIETFTLRPSQPISVDLQINHPFVMESATQGLPLEITCPLKNGWARRSPLSGEETRAEYRLGNPRTGKETQQLAIPMISMGSPQKWTGAVMADPTFSSLYQSPCRRRNSRLAQLSLLGKPRSDLRQRETHVGCVACSRREAARSVRCGGGRHVCDDAPGRSPGPAWLHEIAMIDYDYLSDKGLGWERDVRLLAEWLTPAERRRTALCLHGWYDALGSYCYDASTGQMKTDWLAFGPSQKIRMTRGELKRRLRLARDLGFRVLLYFGDGMTADSRAAGYHDDWVYRDPQDKPISGWQGPDTFGPTFWLNPAASRSLLLVPRLHGRALEDLRRRSGRPGLGRDVRVPHGPNRNQAPAGLLRSGDAGPGQGVVGPGPQVRPAKGLSGLGLHRDQRLGGCSRLRDGGAWHLSGHRLSAGSLVLRAVSQLAKHALEMQLGLREQLCRDAMGRGAVWGAGVDQQWMGRRPRALGVDAERGANCSSHFSVSAGKTSRVRYLTEDPQALLARGLWPPAAGDPLPAPVPGQVNWALANNGARVFRLIVRSGLSAARRDRRHPRRLGLGRWSRPGEAAGRPLPQWVQVDFGQTRQIQQVIVITYQRENSPETATKWGIEDYEIQPGTRPPPDGQR